MQYRVLDLSFDGRYGNIWILKVCILGKNRRILEFDCDLDSIANIVGISRGGEYKGSLRDEEYKDYYSERFGIRIRAQTVHASTCKQFVSRVLRYLNRHNAILYSYIDKHDKVAFANI